MDLVLSLFPGADLLGRAFEACGFCVVRGPDIVWGSDVRDFRAPAGRFSGVIVVVAWSGTGDSAGVSGPGLVTDGASRVA